jgi:hypothetical protein
VWPGKWGVGLATRRGDWRCGGMEILLGSWFEER